MKFPLLPLLCLSLALQSARVQAQTADTTAPAMAPVAAPAPVKIKELVKLFDEGFYDQIIALTSPIIEAAQPQAAQLQKAAQTEQAEQTSPPQLPQPPAAIDPLLFYWRGLAELQVGWFAHARDDMKEVEKAGLKFSGQTPQNVLAKIGRIEATIPPQSYEVKNGDATIFRVYYFQNDPVTTALIDTLPAAYRISSDLFGADLQEQPVFIFNTMPQMAAFMQARGAKSMASWAWAYGSRDVFFFCLEDPQGKPVSSFSEGYVRGAVAHEYNHALFRRAMGTVEVPKWFVEGIATLAGGRIEQEKEAVNDYHLMRLMATNMLVPPQKLETNDAFTDHTEMGQSMSRAGLGKYAPDPYAQGYNMTRFLLANLGEGELPDFLNQVRETKSFDAALQARFGIGLPEFYARWYAALRQKM